jgi:plastocyanin
MEDRPMDRPRARSKWIGAAGAVALLTACGSNLGTPVNAPSTSAPSSGPATLSVNVGQADSTHPERDFLAFYPTTLSAHAGDTLRMVNPTQGTPHTVTFGVLPDHSNQPPLITPGVGFTPIAGGPCLSTEPVTATTTTCPGAPAGAPPPAGTPAPEVSLPGPYSGQPFYNSGIFVGGQTVVLPLAADLKAGPYRFICLLHPTMAATLTVVPAGSPAQTADALKSAADRQLAADMTDAATVASGVPVTSPGIVQAGAVGRELSLDRFFPNAITVSPGETVTWKNDSYEPHVVAIGRQITPEDPLVFGAPIPPSGSAYTSGLAVSGLFGSRPFPSTSYAVKFTTAGTYKYICAIHPGMAGVVEVK